MQLRQATRLKAKIRLGLSAVSGGGKTYTALLIASGMAAWNKIAIIDTENGSADLYSHLGAYNVMTMEQPFTPQKYMDALKDCENAGMEVIIIDSISHDWDNAGGVLETVSKAGGRFQDWKEASPLHRAFINSILQSKCHIITTVRRKQEYSMEKDGNGKTVVTKLGLKEVTREGFEYELTINLELDINHAATAAKDRTGLFMGKPSFIPTKETGALILQWCEQGLDISTEVANSIKALDKCKDVEALKALKEKTPQYVLSNEDFKKAATKRFEKIKESV